SECPGRRRDLPPFPTRRSSDLVVYPHADDAVHACGRGRFDVVFMDFAMGPGRRDGSRAIRELRGAGFGGRIVAISSDPTANAARSEEHTSELQSLTNLVFPLLL